jgi:hypothetical protein
MARVNRMQGAVTSQVFSPLRFIAHFAKIKEALPIHLINLPCLQSRRRRESLRIDDLPRRNEPGQLLLENKQSP